MNTHLPRLDISIVSVLVAGFILCPTAMGAEPAIDPQIARVIAATKAIDNHAHPMRATAEGEEDTDWDQIPSDVEVFTPPVRLRPDNPERLAAWRALFGYKYNDTTGPHVAELTAKRNQLRA